MGSKLFVLGPAKNPDVQFVPSFVLQQQDQTLEGFLLKHPILSPATAIGMSKLRVLNFQYSVMKKLHLKPVKWLSVKDRQFSGLMLTFQPNVDEMRRVFRNIDKDGDGKISPAELKSLLEVFGEENAAAEANSIFQVVDADGDGFISFSEFMDVHKKGIRAGDIRSAFWVFDQNNDGRIDAEEVMAVLRKLGERCSLEECQRMVRQVDRNGDGLVDMDDFMAMMTCTMRLA